MTVNAQRSLRLIPKTDFSRLTGNKGELFYDPVNNTLRIFNSQLVGGEIIATRTWVNSTIAAGVINYNNLTNKPVLFSGSYNDLTNKPNIAGTYQFSVAADDSTQRVISTDEVIKFIGAGGITTASDAEGNITITGAGTSSLVNGARTVSLSSTGTLTIPGDIRSEGNINIEINLSDSTLRRWQFGEDGALTFPDGTNQTTAYTGGTVFTNLIDSADSSAITVTPAAIFSSDVTVENDLLVKNITLMTLGGGSTIKEGLAPNLAGGAIILTPAFGANDNQALVIYPTAGEGNHIHLTANGGTTELYLGDDSQYVKLVNGGNVEVRSSTSGATAAWIFDTEGRLTFPAYPFYVIPEHSYGKAGDTAGMVIIDDTYIYYCTADYVNNATNIWRRTPHAAGTW